MANTTSTTSTTSTTAHDDTRADFLITTAAAAWRAAGSAGKLAGLCRDIIGSGEELLHIDSFLVLYQDNSDFAPRWAIYRATLGREARKAGKKIVFRADVGASSIVKAEPKATAAPKTATADKAATAGAAVADKPVKALEALLETMVAADIAAAVLSMPQDKLAAVTAAMTKASERKPARPRKGSKVATK